MGQSRFRFHVAHSARPRVFKPIRYDCVFYDCNRSSSFAGRYVHACAEISCCCRCSASRKVGTERQTREYSSRRLCAGRPIRSRTHAVLSRRRSHHAPSAQSQSCHEAPTLATQTIIKWSAATSLPRIAVSIFTDVVEWPKIPGARRSMPHAREPPHLPSELHVALS